MDVAFGVEQNVVRLQVSVHDALLVYIPQCACQFGHPEANGILSHGLSRDMESQIAAVHKVLHNVPSCPSAVAPDRRRMWTHRYSMSWKLYRRLRRKGWFRCSSIRRSRIILRTLSERTTAHAKVNTSPSSPFIPPTFIFPYVLERKGQAGVLALDYANLAEGSLAHDSKQSEVIEVDWRRIAGQSR